MQLTPLSLRRCALVVVIISPALAGSQFRCVAVSNPSAVTAPSLATARIDTLEPDTPRVGDIMYATGSGNGTPPLQFIWDFGDGATAAGMQSAHVYTAPGRYTVVLTVRDAFGSSARDLADVAVSPRLQPSMTTMELLSEAVAGQPAMFMATTLDADPNALTYVWTFSDGQSTTGPQAVAIFPVAGAHFASLSVTTDHGETRFGGIAFYVVAGPP